MHNRYCAKKQITCPDGESLQGDRCVQDYVCIGARRIEKENWLSPNSYDNMIRTIIPATTEKECFWKRVGNLIGTDRITWKERESWQKGLEAYERDRDTGPTG